MLDYTKKKNWLYLVTVLLGIITVWNARQTQRWLNIDPVSWEKLERESRGAKTAFYQNQPYQRAAARRVRMWRIVLVFSIFIPSSRFFVGFPQRSFAVFEHNLKCLILKKSWKIFVEEQLCNRNFFEQKKFEKIITIFFFFFFFFFF